MKGGFFILDLKGKRIGFVLTGSFGSFRKTIDELKKIVQLGVKIVPIMSENAYTMDTKFGKAQEFIDEIVYDNNNFRPSYALNYKTPIEYRTQLGFK